MSLSPECWKRILMRPPHSLLVLACILYPALVAIGQESLHFSKKELYELMRQANTPEQCRLLSRYFRAQERAFRVKAAQEQANYRQLLKGWMPSKYPTPAQSQQALYQYQVHRADQMAALAARYEQKLAGNRTGEAVALRPGNIDPASRPEGEISGMTPSEKVLLQRIEVLERLILQLQTAKH
jgi:hypothetical protein